MKKGKPSKTPLTRDVEARVAHCYSTWGKTYFRDYYRSKSAYPPVHQDLVKKELQRHGASTVLDAGCGPASMLRGLRHLGAARYGFDLTPEMVEEAKCVLARQGVPAGNTWVGSVLDPAAYRPGRKIAPSKFESALCFGVLPHIPADADQEVFKNLRGCLKRGGLALVEARNELFSLFTANRYSYEFVLGKLVGGEALLGRSGSDRPAVASALAEYKKFFRMDLPKVRKGKAGEPGYDEVLSRLHNPLVAREQFAEAGFSDVRVLFYHYHCLPPMFEGAAPQTFRRESLRMENPEDWRGYFMASAFILAGIAK